VCDSPAVDIDWNDALVEQLDWHWREHLRPRLGGLSDEEYLWEPVPGCWSLRPRLEARSAMAAGAGDVVIDLAYPPPRPEPVTTIAWRMGHVAVGVLGMRAANHFGDGGVSYETTRWPLTAAAGLDLLDHHYDAWMGGVRSLGLDGLARPCGPAEGPFSEHPLAALVLHISREVIHHGAEMALLRDLYLRRSELG
jgi:hypothetical protein